jgi:hypothetical protein
MNIFLLYVKKSFITAFAGIVLTITLCSCATKNWVNIETEQTITSPTNKQLQNQMKKSVLLKSETAKLMIVTEFNIENIKRVTNDYKKLNKEIKAFITKTDNAQNNYLKHMSSLKKGLSDNALVLDKPNQAKTLKAAKQITNKKLNKWLNFSNNVYSDLTLQYKKFNAKNKLFDLAVRPIIKYHYFPLSNKTVRLLNKSTAEIIKQQKKFMISPNHLINKMPLQEFLFFHGALLNCRKNAKIVGSKIPIQAGDSLWQYEEKLLSPTATPKISNSATEKAFQTMLLNRALVCDVMIRRLKLSQEKPLMLAYFINQLLMIDKFSKESIWKTKINLLSKKYIKNFNARTPMALK